MSECPYYDACPHRPGRVRLKEEITLFCEAKVDGKQCATEIRIGERCPSCGAAFPYPWKVDA